MECLFCSETCDGEYHARCYDAARHTEKKGGVHKDLPLHERLGVAPSHRSWKAALAAVGMAGMAYAAKVTGYASVDKLFICSPRDAAFIRRRGTALYYDNGVFTEAFVQEVMTDADKMLAEVKKTFDVERQLQEYTYTSDLTNPFR